MVRNKQGYIRGFANKKVRSSSKKWMWVGVGWVKGSLGLCKNGKLKSYIFVESFSLIEMLHHDEEFYLQISTMQVLYISH